MKALAQVEDNESGAGVGIDEMRALTQVGVEELFRGIGIDEMVSGSLAQI